MKMEGEIPNFIFVSISVIFSLCYCYVIAKVTPKGTIRLLSILPVICILLILPLNLTSINLGGPVAFFLGWLAPFRLILFALDKGPLSSHPPLSLYAFIPLSCLPISIVKNPETPSLQTTKTGLKSPLNYASKALFLSTFKPIYDNKENLHPKILLFLYGIYLYIALETTFAWMGALARAFLGIRIDPQFDEPYLSTSLQDFWGRRWNLLVSSILRPTVYHPVRSISSRWTGKKWASLIGVISTFVVSGMMHELIFYYIGRQRPTWQVTCFFLIHGVALAFEIILKKAVAGKWALPRVVSGTLTVTFVAITGVWLFLPTMVKCEVDVKATREAIVIMEFTKSLVSKLSTSLC